MAMCGSSLFNWYWLFTDYYYFDLNLQQKEAIAAAVLATTADRQPNVSTANARGSRTRASAVLGARFIADLLTVDDHQYLHEEEEENTNFASRVYIEPLPHYDNNHHA